MDNLNNKIGKEITMDLHADLCITIKKDLKKICSKYENLKLTDENIQKLKNDIFCYLKEYKLLREEYKRYDGLDLECIIIDDPIEPGCIINKDKVNKFYNKKFKHRLNMNNTNLEKRKD